MKCTAITLLPRQDVINNQKKMTNEDVIVFTGEEGHSYSYPFTRPKTANTAQSSLKVTNLNLPKNVNVSKGGTSLDRWSKKRPRLKSSKSCRHLPEFDPEFCYENLDNELSLHFDRSSAPSPSFSLDNLEYEIHSDIEKLWQESVEIVEEKKPDNNKKNKKKKKKVRISKPSSPQTEQVIRVDVTSNVSIGEEKKAVAEEKDCSEIQTPSTENVCDDDFIVKCRQLALMQRKRRWR